MKTATGSSLWRPGNRLLGMGPGLLLAAAFIGPGTVTTASAAGARFGLQLLWAVAFSAVATMVLQEMAARLGLVTRLGLGEAVRAVMRRPVGRTLAIALILIAIGFGNAAYQTGNLTGTHLGMEAMTGWSLKWSISMATFDPQAGRGPAVAIHVWPLIFAAVAFVLLWWGGYRIIERALVGLVVVMSGMFVVTACFVPPNWQELSAGLFLPRVPPEGWLTAMALIATTIVPYNLFLHASAVQEKWPAEISLTESLPTARFDAFISIALGALITMSIIVTAAGALPGFKGELTAAEMAKQLAPSLGRSWAMMMFAVGLTAAGLTSAITAPLAAAYAICGVLGWPRELRSTRYRLVWVTILSVGAVLATFFMKSPAEMIIAAQVAGGILLPFIATFLVLVVNHSRLMRDYRNRWPGNVLGGLVIGITACLGVVTVVRALGWV